MKIQTVAILAIAAMLVGASASGDLVLDPISGVNGLESYFGRDIFEPNYTSPQLQITGRGSLENAGGAAIWREPEFILDIQFLGAYTNENKRSFDDLFVTAAFQPGDAAFERIRFFDPLDDTEYTELSFDEFVQSTALGLPFPPDDTIHGIANGEAGFLSLDGALMGGVDLGVGLQRDRRADVPPTVSVGVQVFCVDPTSKIRFDVFGLQNTSDYGWVVKGNNPNSGSAGTEPFGSTLPPPPEAVVPEPATATLVLVGAGALTWWRRRRDRKQMR